MIPTGREKVNNIYITDNKQHAFDIICKLTKVDLTYNNKENIPIPKSIESNYDSICDKNPLFYLFRNKCEIDLVAIIYDKDLERLGINRKDVEEKLREFVEKS